MLKIRFVRLGRKHDVTYRLIVVDSRKSSQSGAYLEDLGNYNPSQKTFNLKEESIREWISKGAQITDTVHNLLIKAKVIKGKKINVSKQKKRKKGEEDKAEAPAHATGVAGVPVPPEAKVVKEVEQVKKEEVAPAKTEEVKSTEDDKKIEKEEKLAEEKQEPEVKEKPEAEKS